MNAETIKQHVLDLTLDELTDQCVTAGLEKYRGKQIFEWIYKKHKVQFDEMTNLGKELRSRIAAVNDILAAKELARRESSDGTVKLLLEFGEGEQVEAVLIPDEGRLTACLSTQFGCPVHCTFCATGATGYVGNLTAGQIVEQLLRLQLIADENEARISNVVFMGMGEPLLNYDNVMKAIRIINSDWSLNIGARRITVSTIGIPDKIRKLAGENLQITLAISLHTTDQATRENLIPMSKKIMIPVIIDAADFYFKRTGREVTLEYLTIEDVNVSIEDAEKLADIAKRIRANVNVIPFNPIADSMLKGATQAARDRFVSRLRALRVNVNVRSSKGADIEAACGQLKRRMSK